MADVRVDILLLRIKCAADKVTVNLMPGILLHFIRTLLNIVGATQRTSSEIHLPTYLPLFLSFLFSFSFLLPLFLSFFLPFFPSFFPSFFPPVSFLLSPIFFPFFFFSSSVILCSKIVSPCLLEEFTRSPATLLREVHTHAVAEPRCTHVA